MQQKPRGWLLFAIFPIAVALLWLDGSLTLEPQAHQLLEIAIVVLSFGWMALWVRAHPAALPDECAAPSTYFVVPSQKHDLPFVPSARVPDSYPFPHVDTNELAPFDRKGRYN